MIETIDGHRWTVAHYCDGWSDDPPEDVDGTGFADALASWSYVQGYANALDMTARELFAFLDLNADATED